MSNTKGKLRKSIVAVVLGLVCAGLFAGGTDFGAEGAEGKTGLSLEQMLAYAIQDEYLAQAEYRGIMERYGRMRPFSNVVQAEAQHIELLRQLFARYRLDTPADASGGYVAVPATVAEALEAGVKAEMANIAMYEAFLEGASAEALPADVRDVFERLKLASTNHLQAFRTSLSLRAR